MIDNLCRIPAGSRHTQNEGGVSCTIAVHDLCGKNVNLGQDYAVTFQFFTLFSFENGRIIVQTL